MSAQRTMRGRIVKCKMSSGVSSCRREGGRVGADCAGVDTAVSMTSCSDISMVEWCVVEGEWEQQTQTKKFPSIRGATSVTPRRLLNSSMSSATADDNDDYADDVIAMEKMLFAKRHPQQLSLSIQSQTVENRVDREGHSMMVHFLRLAALIQRKKPLDADKREQLLRLAEFFNQTNKEWNPYDGLIELHRDFNDAESGLTDEEWDRLWAEHGKKDRRVYEFELKFDKPKKEWNDDEIAEYSRS